MNAIRFAATYEEFDAYLSSDRKLDRFFARSYQAKWNDRLIS